MVNIEYRVLSSSTPRAYLAPDARLFPPAVRPRKTTGRDRRCSHYSLLVRKGRISTFLLSRVIVWGLIRRLSISTPYWARHECSLEKAPLVRFLRPLIVLWSLSSRRILFSLNHELLVVLTNCVRPVQFIYSSSCLLSCVISVLLLSLPISHHHRLQCIRYRRISFTWS